MSAEAGVPRPRPIALPSASEPLGTLVAFSRAIAAEPVSQRMLRVASRELTLLLNAQAALVSQVEDGLLREIADYARSEQQVARGLSYYLADYPATEAVLRAGLPRGISSSDPGADPAEVFVLREMHMQSVLLVPIVVRDEPWGLIEIYDSKPRDFSVSERHVAELAGSQVAALIAAFEHEEHAQRLYRETLASLSNALEAKDAVTSQHTEEVVRLAVSVAAELDLDLQGVRTVELGAVLHDIGKVRIPEAILNKPGPLTEAEWDVMRTHPAVGEQILRPIQSLQSILPIVRHHHERWDGSGYPDRLIGRAIPLGARIVAVCDAYRAMTEDRPYRGSLGDEKARLELQHGSGTQFDPDCVEALLRALDRRDSAAVVVPLRPPAGIAARQ